MFINRVVGEMHVKLFYVGVLGRGVGFRGEPDEAVVVEEDAQRIARSNEDVDAKIEFVSVDQKWLVAIFLDDHVIVLGNLPTDNDNRDKNDIRITVGK